MLLADENFTWDLDRLNDLCRMMLDHKLQRRIRLGFQGSLHHVPQKTLNLMQKAGFDLAFIGVESASNAQLRRFRKPANRDQMAESIRRAKKAGMACVALWRKKAPAQELSEADEVLEDLAHFDLDKWTNPLE